MADTEKKISELDSAAQINTDDITVLSQGSAGTGFASVKATILAIANKIVSGINFSSALQTTDKTITGAINEVAQGGGGSSTFAGLSDVDIDDTTLADGQVPIWDETEEKWKNGNGGGGTTVVANPTGTPTDELETIQIGNDIYEVVGGGGGGSAEWTDVIGTLEAGDTEIVLSSSKIKTNSVVFPYSDKFGIVPTDMVVANGSVTLTFPVQSEDLGVMVRVSKVNTGKEFTIPLSNFILNKIWKIRDTASSISETADGIKIAGNDYRNDWTSQTLICIDLNEFDIPSVFTKVVVHIVSGVTQDYGGLFILTSDSLFPENESYSYDTILNMTRKLPLLFDNVNGVDVTNYKFEVPCTTLNRYLYIMACDGILSSDSTSGYSNTNNGAWDFTVDGIWIE